MSKKIIALFMASLIMGASVNTFAASHNRLTISAIGAVQGEVVNSLHIEFTDNGGWEEVFYLQLDNAVWNESAVAAYNASNTDYVTYDKQNDTVMKVTIDAKQFENATDIVAVELPLLAKVAQGEAKVSIVSKGGSTISAGTYVFAKVAEPCTSVCGIDLLSINFLDNAGEQEEFYLELNQATWDKQALEIYNNSSKVQYVIQNDTVVKVTIPKEVFEKDTKKVILPILADKQSGAIVSICTFGNTTITEGTYSLS